MASSWAANAAGTAGSAARNSGVNQRPIDCSVIEAIPCARTCAARPVHPDAGGRKADVQHSPRAAIRSGACAASHIPIMPPSEIPQ